MIACSPKTGVCSRLRGAWWMMETCTAAEVGCDSAGDQIYEKKAREVAKQRKESKGEVKRVVWLRREVDGEEVVVGCMVVLARDHSSSPTCEPNFAKRRHPCKSGQMTPATWEPNAQPPWSAIRLSARNIPGTRSSAQ